MKTPRKIYAQYRIMPNLQLHQLRVAAVGKLVCDNFSSEGGSASGGKESLNKNDVILACLFHDMGNIVKFKLDAFPEALQPEGLGYWEKQKAATIKKYGPEQHRVSEAIARELGLPETVIRMIGNSGVSRLPEILLGGPTELKVLQYADLRVAPFGIVSLAERFEDFTRRYPDGKDARLFGAGKALETGIFAHARIKPENITDEAAAPLIEELWDYALA